MIAVIDLTAFEESFLVCDIKIKWYRLNVYYGFSCMSTEPVIFDLGLEKMRQLEKKYLIKNIIFFYPFINTHTLI